MKGQRAAGALLRQLREHGVELWSEAGRLRYSAPRGIISDDVLGALREHKDEIIKLLQAAEHDRTVRRVPRQARMPLSFAQQRIWFLSELEPDNPAYNVALAKRICGPVDSELLASSLGYLLQRHEALRSVCISDANGPQLQITAPEELATNRTWFRETALPAATSDTALTRLINTEVGSAISLRQAPLLRAHLFRRGADDAVLTLTTHHFVVDGWSCGVLLRELSQVYQALHAGAPVTLPALQLQYADFAAWQASWMNSGARHEQLDYWRTQLAGLSTLELPTDQLRPAVQSHRGDVIHFDLDEALSAGLRQVSRDLGATLYMTLLAAFQVLLHRYSGQDEVVLGTAVSNRHAADLESIIGPFANMLVLRGDLSEDSGFADFVARTQALATRAFARQDLPFEALVEELRPSRDRSRGPLFQVLFVLHQYQNDEELALPAAAVSNFPVTRGTAMYDLFLQVVELNGQLSVALEYNTDLFTSATCERLREQFTQLLQAIVAQPEQSLSELPLLSPAQQQLLLTAQQPTVQTWPHSRVHELVEAAAARTPDAVALTAAGATLSYAELNARANRMARALRAAGAGPGQLVGIATERGIAQALSVLATLKAGAAYVPLDPHYPPQRLQFMLEDSAAGLLVTDAGTAATLPPHSATVVLIDELRWDTGDASNLDAPCGESVYVIYTSGSTGTPKGVELTHAGLANLIQWQNTQPRLDAPARTLQFASLSFDVSFQELFTTWSQGGTVVLVSDALRRDLAALAGYVAEQQIERLFLPCAALQPLAEELLRATDKLPLRDVIVAGEQLQITPAVRQLFEQLDGARLHNHYGPSETHVVTSWTLPASVGLWPALPPIGQPVSNTVAWVLDARQRPVPIGVPGELYIAGVQVASGYRGRSDLNAARFSDDPGGSGRMYRTGDRVRWLDATTLEYLGRTDAQIKVRGYRIEPGEIEARLLGLPGVRQCAVLLQQDAAAGPRLVAYVVAQADGPVDVAALRDGLQKHLPDYMVPTAFVALDMLPLTPSGKLDRSALPAPDYVAADSVYVAARTPLETSLVEIWTRLLGVERVGINDDFFALGGHSLLATQLMSRVRDQCNVELPLNTLFDQPTVAALATAVQQAQADTDVTAARQAPAAPPPRGLAAADRSAPLPLSYAQQRLRFLDQLEPGSSLYNMPFALRISGELDQAALQAAVDALVARHETLRTVFPPGGEVPEQIVQPHLQIATQYENLGSTDDFEARATELAAVRFDLATGPLLNLHVLSSGAEQHCLVFVIHHIVCDLWSMDRLFRDLGHFYAAHTSGTPATLPPLPAQYADYAVWQRQRLQGERLARLTDYWRGRLADAPAVLELPLDHPRPAEPSYAGAWLTMRIPAPLARELEVRAAEHGCTIFMLTCAVFGVLLSKHSGRHDCVLGTPIAGRLHTDLEDLIGFFLNTLALRIDTSGDPVFSDFLQGLRRHTLAAYDHQELPFEQLVELLQPSRDMSFAPVFQHLFICQDHRDLGLQLPGLEVQEAKLVSAGNSKFDLTLSYKRDNEGAEIGMEYATELFAPASIKRLLQQYATLLRAVVRDPAQRLSALNVADGEERTRLLLQSRGVSQPFAAARCLHRMVEAQVARTPTATAVRCGATALSYTQLNTRANHVAQQLVSCGAGPGERVAIACARSLELAVAVLAVVKTGACYVPIDPAYPEQRVALMLEDSGARLLLTDAATQLDSPSARRLLLDELDTGATAANLADTATLSDPVYCMYTSGSTGTPKGVLQSHAALANLLAWQQQHPRLGQPRVTLQFAALSFDVSVQEFFGTWTSGGCVHVVTDELRRDLPQLARVISSAGIERLYLPFAALSALVDGLLQGPAPAALRDIIVAGEQLQITDPLRELCDRLPACALHNQYGPTETHVVTALTLECPAGEWPALPTIGRPVTNNECYVLDDAGQPTALGTPGELYVGGAQVALGYLGRPELEAERFIAHPFGGAGRLYRTGDRARWLETGELQFLGRCDDQLKWRGFRIEPGEVENAMCALPGIKRAAVLLHHSPPAPDQLVGYFTASQEAAEDDIAARIRAQLKASLPDYMLPTALVSLDEWPLTPSGKVDRRRLPPPAAESGSAAAYVAPRTPTEQTLAEVWADVLGLPRAGMHDDFFALGGHSLLATQVITRIGEQLGVQLPLKYLFRYPTPAELGAALETLSNAQISQAEADDSPRDEFMI